LTTFLRIPNVECSIKTFAWQAKQGKVLAPTDSGEVIVEVEVVPTGKVAEVVARMDEKKVETRAFHEGCESVAIEGKHTAHLLC
jgi:translation elongation factor P/translation initiation factor 5A